MRLTPTKFCSRINRQAFTLVELMMALSVGLVLSGTVVLLLVQGSLEQRKGYADMTVEESAYTLQANIINCLRGMSAGLGMTPTDSNGPNGTSTGIVVFRSNPDGSNTRQQINFYSTNGSVVYIPNNAYPTNKVVWMTSGQKVKLRNLYFSPSLNPDVSMNNSLVNVVFTMDDNGFSQQSLYPTNSPASICRSFSVQMRCD
jgi:prepilin-type N-terminal cleavage/methylation domain-containing protein